MDERARRDVVEAENERLRERIEQLEGLLFETRIPCPLEWGLTAHEARIFGLLANREMATKEQLLLAMYSHLASPDDVPELKIVDVFICKLRKKLPAAVKVVTIWGMGYSLDAASRGRFGHAEQRRGQAA